MLRTLARNIVSNWVGLAVQIAVVFFLTPFIVHTLGDTRYGVWALITSFTGYYGLLDLGFRSGITQYLTRYLATKDFDRLNSTASTAVVALACCGAFTGFLSLGIAWIAPSIFTIPQDAIAEARWCIIIIGLSAGFQFPFFLYSSVFTAMQRYDLANGVGIAVRLATAVAIVICLRNGYGLIGLCAVNAVGLLLGSLARWRIAVHILPEMKLSPGLAAWSSLRSLANFGLWSFLIQNAIVWKSSVGGIIIAIFMPVAALAPYSLALGLVSYFSSVFGSMGVVFFPAATQLDAQGDERRLRIMYLAGSKMIILLAMVSLLIGIIWATDFFRLWVGERFVDGNEYPSVALLFSFLISAAFVTVAQKIGSQIMMGRRRLKELAFLAVGEAAVSVVLCVLLIQTYGLVGVTLGVLISAIVFRGIMYPIVVCRTLCISAKEYLRLVWLRPCLVGFALCGGLALLHHVLPTANSWQILILSGICAAVLSVLVLVIVGLDGAEKQRFILEPMARLRLRVESKLS